MNHNLDIALSTMASTLRMWRGTSSTRSNIQPPKELVLFDREGDPQCRRVREVLTAMDLDVTIAPCPIGGRNIKQLKAESGNATLPMLYDSNTEERRIGADNVIQYLFKQYRGADAPEKYFEGSLTTLGSQVATLFRNQAGLKARPSIQPEKPLTLYSFESSPYSRPVRERLCELEIPYYLINLGKQKWSDMGPAKPRLTLKPYRPLAGTKRDAFFKQHGNVQVPYLIDPNTGVCMFESADILAYLSQTYGR